MRTGLAGPRSARRCRQGLRPVQLLPVTRGARRKARISDHHPPRAADRAARAGRAALGVSNSVAIRDLDYPRFERPFRTLVSDRLNGGVTADATGLGSREFSASPQPIAIRRF